MSFDLARAVRDAITPLSKFERLVLLTLATYARRKGVTMFPSQKTLAAKTALTRRTVQRVLQELEWQEILPVLERGRPRRSACYSISVDALASGERKPPKGVSVTPSKPPKGVTLTPSKLPAKGVGRTPLRRKRNASEASPLRLRGVSLTPDLVLDLGSDPGLEQVHPSRRASPDSAQGAAFARFWTAYPKKVAKVAAAKAFQQLAPDPKLLAAMLDAIGWQQHLPEWRTRNGQYIPYPATWLRGRRWEDTRPHDGHVDATDKAWDAVMRRHARAEEKR